MNQATSIALIADIHGNIPALMAVDEDIRQRGIDTIYCLGDMCGRGPNGSLAIDYCRERCEVILMGNWEDHVAAGNRQDYLEEMGPERQAFIQTLPLYHRMWISGRRLHLFHGRPLIGGVVYGEADDEKKLTLFSAVEDEHPVDIVGYADIHRQYKTDFKDDYRVLFNTGSVGNSYCTPTACYAILRGVMDSTEKAPVSIEFVSVPYDNQQAVENARKESAWFTAQEAYAREVTLGKWQPGL